MLQPIEKQIQAAPYVRVVLFPGSARGAKGIEVKACQRSVIIRPDITFEVHLTELIDELASRGLTMTAQTEKELKFAF
jgi:hypothetical protein